MKKLSYIFIIILTLSCQELDFNPLSEGSSGNWFADQSQIEMSLNSLYQFKYWAGDFDDRDHWTDDWTMRNRLSAVTSGTINGESGMVKNLWARSYQAISQANTIIEALETLPIKDELPAETLNRYIGEAKFVRASMYALLISHFGDVVYFTENLDLEEAFSLGRTDKATVLESIYEDYDFAISHLPIAYADSELKRATKGAALALKARIALYNEDWTIARDATQEVMDLGVYELHPDLRELFLSKTKNPKEVIMLTPRSVELGVAFTWKTRRYLTRMGGGWNQNHPSWELFASFLCTDGLPIDESPLFNPQEPFKNRDPRCAYTIVEHGTEHLGAIFQPHVDTLEVYSYTAGKYVQNLDNRAIKAGASYNGLAWRKWIDEEWLDRKAENDVYIIRYADVLLMYAEAKIELNEIDQSVINVMNQVRARAYKVDASETSAYPAITETDQTELRKILRIERRMELAREGLRYMDLIRWRLAEKVLNRPAYGLLDPTDLKANIIDKGLWFWPMTPTIEEDGTVLLDDLFNQGYAKKLATRSFDASRQYLWPIPSKEILINSNLGQNIGY